MFAELKRYKDEHGDCDVPDRWSENPQLAKWVAHQRRFKKAGKLSLEHEQRLDALGFDWEPLQSLWEIRFAELKRYRDQHGHCNVSRREGPQLKAWVDHQRRAERTGTLSAERKARLDELGFVWSAARSARSTSTDEPGVIQS